MRSGTQPVMTAHRAGAKNPECGTFAFSKTTVRAQWYYIFLGLLKKPAYI